MRVLFASRPAFGHVFAMMPLALAAREAGHEVVFATGESFVPRLEGWGFDARPVGEGVEWAFQQAAAQWPELLQPEQPEFGARLFVDVLGTRTLAEMTPILDDVEPNLVVYEATDVGAGVAAARAGVPAVCHSLSVWVGMFRDALRERMQVLWGAAGGESLIDVTIGDAYLDIWPASMQAPEAAAAIERLVPLRPIPWSDPAAAVPELPSGDAPLVFVSLGTVFWGKELLTKVIEALSTIDVRALVLAGVDATPDELPSGDRVRVTGFVNQPEVLRRADAVVHHGGAGTLLGSLASGLPQLCLPQGADRPHTAASLARSGAGVVHDPSSVTPEQIAAAVESLLEESDYRRRAETLRGEIDQMPSPAEVVTTLEDVVA